MGVRFANNATSLLDGAIDAVVTTLVVTTGEGALFPTAGAGDWFPITVVNFTDDLEIMYCTARSGDTLTVTRGQEGTAAIAFPDAARVDHRLTAALILPDAPSDADNYGRHAGGWQAIVYPTWTTLSGKPATFPPSTHSHAESDITGLTADLTARVLKAGDTMTGQLAIAPPSGSPSLLLRKSSGAGGSSNVILAYKALLPRWVFALGDGIAESGGDAGSNITLDRYSDGGSYLGTAWSINRASGIVGMPSGATTLTRAAADNSTAVATTAHVKSYVTQPATSDLPPANPIPGQIWWRSSTGNLFIWYLDPGGLPGQWVQVNFGAAGPPGPPGGIGEAPMDGQQYARSNAVWELVEESGISGWDTLPGKPDTFPPTVPIPSSDITGLDASQTAQDALIAGKLDASAYTAADVLAKVLTVDGSGSGLDADLLDGQSSAYYLPAANLTGGKITIGTTAPSSPAVNDIWIDTT